MESPREQETRRVSSATGCQSEWHADIADEELLRLADTFRATLITTDSLRLERRLVRDGHIQTFWLPPVLAIGEQLVLVLQHFDLVLREPRCMHCGGELRGVSMQAVWERIPPRTRRWRNDYFECVRCAQLYWHGTHWQRIRERLRMLSFWSRQWQPQPEPQPHPPKSSSVGTRPNSKVRVT